MSMKSGNDSQNEMEEGVKSPAPPSEESLEKSTEPVDQNFSAPLDPKYGDLQHIKSLANQKLFQVARSETGELSPEAEQTITRFVNQVSRGYAASIGMICPGNSCAFRSACPLYQSNTPLPKGKKCHPPDTKVLTTSGWKNIADLNTKDKIITYSTRKTSQSASNTLRTKGRKFRLASRYYEGNMLTLSAGGQSVKCTPDHISVVKWNKEAIGKFVVYLMQKGDNFRIGKTSLLWQAKNGKKIHSGIAARGRTEKADRMWILGVYDSNSEALLAEEYFSVSGGIPKALFIATNNRKTKHDGLYAWVTQEVLDKHHLLCKKPMSHYVDFLDSLGLSIDSPIWVYKDSVYGDKSQNIGGITNSFITSACNIVPGIMDIPVVTDDTIGCKYKPQWCVVNVEKEHYEGFVYSLDVEKEHTYVANKIVTHNCPVEDTIINLWVSKHLQSLGITDIDDPAHSFDMDMLYELAGQELIRWRCSVHLSDSPALVENKVTGYSMNGDAIFEDVINPVLDVMERAGRNIAKIREALVATRESQLRIGQTMADPTQKAAALREKAKQIAAQRRNAAETIKEAEFNVKEN